MPDFLERCTFTTDRQCVNNAAFIDLYDSVGFGHPADYEPPADYMEKVFGPGVHGFFAFDDDRLIAVARVLSDDIYCTWIAEICVHPEWQRKGVGKALLEMINARFPHTALYAEAFKGQEKIFTGRGITPKNKLVACSRAPINDS